MLLYGSETWTSLKIDSQAPQTQACHMRCQRRILRISWTERVTNAEVSSLTGLPDITSVIAQRRHALFGHVRRLSSDTPAHKALHLAVQLRQGTHAPGCIMATTSWSVSSSKILASQQISLWNVAADRTERAAVPPSAGSRDRR